MIILLMLFIFKCEAADLHAGEQKSKTCIACHGENGVSLNEFWPNLAGQKEKYLFEQLKAFHDGVRMNTVMGPVAKMLTEQDMQDLAAYFASRKAP